MIADAERLIARLRELADRKTGYIYTPDVHGLLAAAAEIEELAAALAAATAELRAWRDKFFDQADLELLSRANRLLGGAALASRVPQDGKP